MDLPIFWFVIIAVLWAGFLILEGFDFGVGMLHGFVGRTEREREVALGTIKPVWDGNEVWLVVAGAGTFAAFPAWYATMFSAYYVVLVLVLAALIIRGVSFEFRERRDSAGWRRTWSTTMTVGSLLVPLLLGVGLADLLYGLPIGSDQEFAGDVMDLLIPYSLYVGGTVVLLCVLLGATFLALKTAGTVRTRAARLARWVAPVTLVVMIGFALWTADVATGDLVPGVMEVLPLLAILACVWLVFRAREGWAFTFAVATMAAVVAALFVNLYPNVMVSSTDPSFSLTVEGASSSPYALRVMTVVALVLLPVVLLYQGWTYYVFRQRVSSSDAESEPTATAY
jgi:cytochrome d ubiquinol oxidase subunit II